MNNLSVLERIQLARRSGLTSRLAKGAAAIGQIRRMGVFCTGEWSGTCPCNPRSDFCDAKMRWLELAEEFYGGPPWGLTGFEKFYLVEAMTVSQWAATGLTIRVLPPTGNEVIKVGPRGTDWKTITQLGELLGTQEYPELLASVIKIQKVVHGSV